MLYPLDDAPDLRIILCRNEREQKHVRHVFPEFHVALPDDDHQGYFFETIVFTHPSDLIVDWSTRLRPNGRLLVLGLTE